MDRKKTYAALSLGIIALCAFWCSFFLMWQNGLPGNETPHYASRIAEIGLYFAIAYAASRMKIDPALATLGSLACQMLSLVFAGFFPLAEGIASGASVSLFAVAGLALFARFSRRSSQIAFIFSMLLSHVLSICLSALPPDTFTVVRDALQSAAPLLLLASLLVTKELASDTPVEATGVKNIKESRTLIAGALIFALLCGFASQVFIDKGTELGLVNLFVELSSIALLLLLLIACAVFREMTLDTALLVVLSLFAIALLGSMLLLGNQTVNVGVFVRAGFDVFQVMVWLYFIDKARGESMYALSRFSLVNGSLRLCVLASRLLAAWVCSALPIETISTLMFALIVVWLAATIILLFTAHALNSRSARLPPLETDIDRGFETGFEARCAQLANSRKLSAREREILEHFAHGRSTSHIAKTLFISENTVKTHIRRIYQKAEVHSRQELLDKIEAAECDDAPAEPHAR